MVFIYIDDIFNSIIDALKEDANSKKQGMHFNILYTKTKETLSQTSSYRDFTPSRSVISRHLEQMVRENILDRRVEQNSKLKIPPVNYSLSESAKRKDKLKLLRRDEQQMLFKKIYENLFFYEAFHKPLRIISSEQEFDRFLSRLNLTDKDMQWNRVITTETTAVNNLIYGSGEYLPSESERKKLSKEYWSKREAGESTVLEEIEFFHTLNIGNHKLRLTRKDYWEIHRYSENKKYHTEYTYTLPGFTVDEFLENQSIGSEFKRPTVEEAFLLMRKNGLIRPDLVLPDEIRFVLKDEELSAFLNLLKGFHYYEFGSLSYKWYVLEGPSTQEVKIITELLGEYEANRIFRSAELERHKNKTIWKEYKNVKEYNEYVKDRDCSTSLQAARYDGHLEEYEKRRRKSPITEEEKKEDVRRYSVYLNKSLKQRLERQLERLYFDLEDARIEFADIIKKYDFLQDVLKNVCIKMFEPPNDELWSKVIEYRKEMGMDQT